MSQKNEKIRRKVDRLEGQLEYLSSSFEEHLARAEYEQDCKDRARKKAYTDRRMRRILEAEEAARNWKAIAYAALVTAIIVLIIAIAAVKAKAIDPVLQETAPANELMISTTENNDSSREYCEKSPIFITSLDQIAGSENVVEDLENEKIEVALLAKANVIEDCEVTWYTEATCGKSPDHPAYGITRSGLPVVENLTCAVDPNVIPMYSDVFVEYADGTIEQLWATDTGVKGNALDIYTPDYDYAMQCGRQWLTVYWIPPWEVD